MWYAPAKSPTTQPPITTSATLSSRSRGFLHKPIFPAGSTSRNNRSLVVSRTSRTYERSTFVLSKVRDFPRSSVFSLNHHFQIYFKPRPVFPEQYVAQDHRMETALLEPSVGAVLLSLQSQ